MTDRAILVLAFSCVFLGCAIIYHARKVKKMTDATNSLDAVTNRLATAVRGVADRFAAYVGNHPGEDSAAIREDVTRLGAAADALDAIGADAPEQPAPAPVVEAAAEAAHPDDAEA